MTMPRLFVVVPVFNEAPNLPRLFSSFRDIEPQLGDKFNLNFIIVDDGSNDGTPVIARQLADNLALEVLSHTSNSGPGAAFATAFAHLATAMGSNDWVITMEGDNTSRHSLIHQMLRRADEGFDAVFASPYMYGGGLTQTTLLRRFLSSIANLVVKDMLNVQGILTVSSFFRLYRATTLSRLQAAFGPCIVERRGFESMVEMTMKMTMLGITISEVAMQLDSSLRKGKSKMKILRTIVGYFALCTYKDKWLRAVHASQTSSAVSNRPDPLQAREQ